MGIRYQTQRTVILRLKPILNSSKFRIEMQIEMNFHIYRSIQQLRKISTLIGTLKCERDCGTRPMSTYGGIVCIRMWELSLSRGQVEARMMATRMMLSAGST